MDFGDGVEHMTCGLAVKNKKNLNSGDPLAAP
jgi:hypothetical protein